MRMSITKKLILGFLGLSLLVLMAGVVGIFVLNKVSLIADTVTKEKAPMQNAVMSATIEVEKLQKYLIEYNSAIFNLEETGSKIAASMAEFDMWIAMLQYGTASNEFRNNPAQALYQNKKLNLVVPSSSVEMSPIVRGISEESIRLKAEVAELIASKKIFNSYGVKVGEELLDLPAFLNLAQLGNLDWTRQLKDAVNIETKFTANTDPTKGLIGEWLESYRVANQELMDMLAGFKENYGKLMAMAEKINEFPTFKDKSRTLNRGIAITLRIERSFIDLHVLAKNMYTTLQNDRKQKQNNLEVSVKSINSQLSTLVSIAEKEMHTAIDEAATAKNSGSTMLIILTVIAVILAVVLGTLVSRSMSSKILSVAVSTKNIADGDLRNDLAITSNDEIGDLARDTNLMTTNLRQMIGKILTFASKLTASSADLTGVSKDFEQDSADLNAKAREASEATSTMNASMNDILTLANDSNQRVQNVAIATEEMSSTIAEIARNTEQAREVSSKAVATVENTTAKMNELSNAANEIGKVAEVIGNIAKQTNLLSLNATIEAARAGDAGRGFAVVANEVKELASQTNKATGDIRSMIEAIQQSSTMTISEIARISDIINEINSIVVVIAGAVEEQAVTTKQITEDINSVSEGFEAMTVHINSTTEISRMVAADINAVNTTSLNVGQGSSYIQKSSIELGNLADELNRLVGQFKL